MAYIYIKLLKCFTFESLKLRNGLSNQLPISNTSCHTTSLYENRLWCLTLAPCRRYKAQYPEGFKIQVAPCRNVQIASKSISRKGVLSCTIDFCRSLIFTSSVMEIQQCKVGTRFPLESRLSQSHSGEWKRFKD